MPPNVQLIHGDVTHLDLPPAFADVAVSLATWHETGGVLDLPGLFRALRPGGRLIVIDWRRNADSHKEGPPAAIRTTKEEVASHLPPWFLPFHLEDLGTNMFVVIARRNESAT